MESSASGSAARSSSSSSNSMGQWPAEHCAANAAGGAHGDSRSQQYGHHERRHHDHRRPEHHHHHREQHEHHSSSATFVDHESSSHSRTRSPLRSSDAFHSRDRHNDRSHRGYAHDHHRLDARESYDDGDRAFDEDRSQRHHRHHSSRDAYDYDDHARQAPNAQIRDAPPSRTLILRGLTPAVSERMILSALAAFRPTFARVIYNKATGESRGFAFVSFQNIPDATQVVLAYTHGPLHLDGQPVALGFTDNDRSSRDATSETGNWVCAQCLGVNFARRERCYMCNTSRHEAAHTGSARAGPPHHSSHHSYSHYYGSSEADGAALSSVLLVRMLPEDIEEGELHVAFAEFDGVKDIRLIRDRATNLSRGFGFVEFVDVESAKRALDASDSVRVHGREVRVSFARDTAKHSGHTLSVGASHATNSIAAAALEQAQWSLANGYNSGSAASSVAAQGEHRDASTELDADVSAFLASTVAATPARPKKQWPLPFETGGGSYVYASDLGLYYDSDSAFYYDAQSKVYYSSFTGQYFTCSDGSRGASATFNAFAPPPPSDDALVAVRAPALAAAAPAPVAGVTLSLAKKKEKKTLAFGVLGPIATKSKAPVSSAPAASAAAAPTGVNHASGGLTKRKSAVDIAKWSQLQRASKASDTDAVPSGPGPSPSAAGPAAPSKASAELDQLVSAATEAPICLLCRRKFTSMALLRKHETLSKLHLENLAKAKADKDVLASEYREMERAQKDRLEATTTTAQQQSERKRQRSTAPSAAPASDVAPSASLEAGIGGKMLKMMGWKRGEGLGKHGTGITAPVAAAVGNVGSETAGIGARPAAAAAAVPPPPIDLSDMASYKERLQQMARARYDSTPRGL